MSVLEAWGSPDRDLVGGWEDRSACGRGSYRKTGFLVLGFEASKRKERIKKEKTEKRERKEV